MKQHLNFLLKLKAFIYYSIVKLQGDKLARRILDLKGVNLTLVGVVYAVIDVQLNLILMKSVIKDHLCSPAWLYAVVSSIFLGIHFSWF